MEVQYIGGKTWYRGVNLSELNMIVPPKPRSNGTGIRIDVTTYIDDAVIVDNSADWSNLYSYLRTNHPDGYSGTVDLAFVGQYTPCLAFYVIPTSSYEAGGSGYDVICDSNPGVGAWISFNGGSWFNRERWGSWEEYMWDWRRKIEHFNVSETTMEQIWPAYKQTLNSRIKFPRFFAQNIDNQIIMDPQPEDCWDYSQFRQATPSEGEILWTEEDEPVDTSWTHPKSKLISLHAWKLTNESELNYQKSLWSMDTNSTKISNSLYANPMDAIVGEQFIPFEFPDEQLSAREQAILVGIQELSYNDTPVKAYFLTDEYHQIELGSQVINRTFNDYRDFTETSIDLFLPCIGWKKLDAQTYMGKELIIKYRIDFVTGDILALLITNPGNIIQDTVKGNCLSQIPISGRDFTSLLQARLQQQNAALTAAGGFAMGVGSVAAGLYTGNPTLVAGGVAGAIGSVASGIQSGKAGQINATKAVNQVVKDGSMGGAAGVLNYGRAYLVISRHEDAMPLRYQNYEGYQSNKILTITNLTGYIKAREVYFSSARATEQEKAMVEQMLKEGVFK